MLHKYHLNSLVLVLLFTLGSLSGCTGGGEAAPGSGDGTGNGTGDGSGDGVGNVNNPDDSGGTPPVDPLPESDSPGGIWAGTITSTETGEDFESIGLVTEAGQLRFITDDREQIAGDVTVDDKTFTGDITAYAPVDELLVYSKGENPVTGTVTGTVNERSSFDGSATLNDSVTSNFDFTYDAEKYEKHSSLSLLSGNYSITDDENHTLTISITADGIITGSDNGVLTGGVNEGCVMNGVAELLDPDFNMYHLQIKTTDCGELDGNFRGPASLFDVDTENDTLVFSLECVRFLLAGSITRT